MRIYSDQSYLPVGVAHNVLLVPFWGHIPAAHGYGPMETFLDSYKSTAATFLEMTDLASCEYAVLPATWAVAKASAAAMDLATRFAARARDAGKPVLVIDNSDCDAPVELSVPTIVFRTSLYRSTRRSNEWAMPAWSEDFLRVHCEGLLQTRRKSAVPTIGFCGVADLTAPPSLLARTLNRITGRQTSARVHPAYETRNSALHRLLASPGLTTNFVLRRGFFGDVLIDGRVDSTTLFARRREYLDNMLQSDYVLSCRGEGNYSYRLYETLSAGRIPVLVDTDCVLPREDEIDWSSYCVRVGRDQVPDIGSIIVDFHRHISETEFVERQRACRALWETKLAPGVFFEHVARRLSCSGQNCTTEAAADV